MVNLLSDYAWLGAICAYFFGTIFGSFANVVIYRLPKGESVVQPGSHCGQCEKPVPWFHNIPVFSWFILRGKCCFCQTKYSFRYPLVEFITGALFTALYLYVGHQYVLIEYFIFAFCLVIVTFIDFDHMILPDVFTLSGIVIGLVGAAINPDREFLPALYGVLMGGGFLWTISYIYSALRNQEGMGGGDIKLLAWIGAVLGWKSIPFVIMGSSILGSFVGIAVGVISKEGLKAKIPFGPYLALAAIIYILGGRDIGEWYLGLFIPIDS